MHASTTKIVLGFLFLTDLSDLKSHLHFSFWDINSEGQAIAFRLLSVQVELCREGKHQLHFCSFAREVKITLTRAWKLCLRHICISETFRAAIWSSSHTKHCSLDLASQLDVQFGEGSTTFLIRSLNSTFQRGSNAYWLSWEKEWKQLNCKKTSSGWTMHIDTTYLHFLSLSLKSNLGLERQ